MPTMNVIRRQKLMVLALACVLASRCMALSLPRHPNAVVS